MPFDEVMDRAKEDRNIIMRLRYIIVEQILQILALSFLLYYTQFTIELKRSDATWYKSSSMPTDLMEDNAESCFQCDSGKRQRVTGTEVGA